MNPSSAWRTGPLRSLRPVAWLAAALLAATGILTAAGDDSFRRFLGGVHPLVVVTAAGLLCAGTLAFLHARHGFAVYRRDPAGPATAAGLALGMAVIMVGVDVMVPLPADINIPFPASVLFYPVIGFVAETAFHLVPLTLLLGVLARPGRGREPRRVAAAVVLTALVEPAYQTVLADPGTPVWQTGYIAAHVFVFGLLQLWVFRRYDFVSMYVFRLAYYLVWHVVWGHFRLSFLF